MFNSASSLDIKYTATIVGRTQCAVRYTVVANSFIIIIFFFLCSLRIGIRSEPENSVIGNGCS